jgi:hypothetical protein
VTDRSHQASITVSPQAVQAIVDEFATLPAGLKVTATLESGQIAVHIGGSISEPGVTVDVTGDATMTLSVNGGVLAPNITVEDQNVSISLDWWVWLLSVVVPELAVIGGIPVVAAVDAIANSVANTILQKFISTLVATANSFGVQTDGLAAPFTIDAVKIQTQGITLQATAPITTPTSSTFVQGMVTDQENQAPITGATVTINPGGQAGWAPQSTTDETGMYRFDTGSLDVFANNPPGTGPFAITAGQSDFITSTSTVTVEWGQTVIRDFALQPVLDITVEGQVLGNGAPVNGAAVTLAYTPDEPGQPASGPIANANPKPDGSYIIKTNPGQYTGGYTGDRQLSNDNAGCGPVRYWMRSRRFRPRTTVAVAVGVVIVDHSRGGLNAKVSGALRIP